MSESNSEAKTQSNIGQQKAIDQLKQQEELEDREEEIFEHSLPDKGELLTGVNVLVTRGVQQSSPMSEQLLELGSGVFEFPVIALVRPDSYAELEEAFENIESYDWIVFASVNAVEFFFEHYRQCKKDESKINPESSPLRFATIGPATGDALARQGFRSSFTPQSFVADALVDEFEGNYILTGSRFLWPRTNIGRQLIKERFTKAGALVDVVTVYQTVLPEEALAKSGDLLKLLETKSVDFVALASSQSVKNFATIIRHAIEENHNKSGRSKHTKQAEEAMSDDEVSLTLAHSLLGIEFLSIGPETSKTIEEVLGRTPLQARTFTIPGMVERLIESVTAIG